MHSGKAKSSELIIFDDGTLYHIDLKQKDAIPKNLLLMGASGRVNDVAKQFDSITFRHRNKARPEFYIVAGTYKKTPIAAFSIGIGPDNMEIALNELHALFEYDHVKNHWAQTKPSVNIIRVGTAGSSLPELSPGTIAISEYSLGLDNLGIFYPPKKLNDSAVKIEKAFSDMNIGTIRLSSYCSKASESAIRALQKAAAGYVSTIKIVSGITTSSPGFFAAEGRNIGRIKPVFSLNKFVAAVQRFTATGGLRIVSHEMETSILFRIGNEILGYNTGAVCLILDNLASDDFMDAQEAKRRMDACITIALDALVLLAKNN